MRSLEILSSQRLIVGESPLWDDRTQTLYTIDVRGRSIQKLDWNTGERSELSLPQMVGSIALREDGSLMAALEDGIYLVAENGTLRCLHQPVTIKGDQFNDGKVGPDGNFYVGTMAANFGGAFYRLRPEGTLEELFDHVGCSNGLAWSVDGKTMYYCDSSAGNVEAFDFDSFSNRRTICTIPGGIGEFDGMTIDAAGHLWVGVWDGSCIYEVDPAIGIVGKMELPVSRGTCCTFAGKDLDTMVITTSAKEISPEKEPQAGYTFCTKAAVPGMAPTYRFPVTEV